MTMYKIVFKKTFSPIFIKASYINNKNDLYTNFVVLNKDNGLVDKTHRIETNNILAIREVK